MSAESSRETILVVDDLPENIQVLNAVLQETYRVYFATSGEMALKKARNSSIDLILLDVMMPEMDGFEVCKRLKEDSLTSDIPVIFVTALNDDDDESRGLTIGGVDYISKPIRASIVRARVRIHLELKRKREYLAKLSSIDGLTAIANRRRFDEYLEQEWKRGMRDGRPLSLIMMDLDYFKQYNDKYGHTMGDECLKSVAKALKAATPRASDLVARYGGEEFICLLPDTEIEGAHKVAVNINKLIAALAVPHETSKVSDQVTMSIGVTTMLPNDQSTTGELLKMVDQLLYEAKNGGRNRIVHKPMVGS